MKRSATADRAIELARNDLACFCALAWPRFEIARHHRQIIDALERVESGQDGRLMIFMPPRHGKSLTASQLFPAWYLGRHPDRSIIASSYGQELASDFGRRVRNYVADPLHATIFPKCKLSDDSTAAHRFNLLSGGAFFAVGAGGPITGRGADLLLIDDPIKSREVAFSSTSRRTLQEWYESVAYTRLMPGASIVLIQTRWHEADLAGWLLSEHADEGWTVLNLPAIAENEETWRREGAPLWPEKYPLPKLAKIKQAIGGSAWAAMYQQRPAAAEGMIFRREWWRYWTALPERFDSITLSLDTAFKTGTSNDYSVAVVLGVTSTGYYLLDLWRERVEFPELKRKVGALAARWSPNVVLVEDKASGQSLIQELQTATNLPIKAIKVDADKVTRAYAVTPLIEAGKVYIPKMDLDGFEWVREFVEELSSFDAAPHDDQVDAFTQGLNYLRDKGNPGIIEFYREKLGLMDAPREAAEGAPSKPGAPGDEEEYNELIEIYERERFEADKAR